MKILVNYFFSSRIGTERVKDTRKTPSMLLDSCCWSWTKSVSSDSRKYMTLEHQYLYLSQCLLFIIEKQENFNQTQSMPDVSFVGVNMRSKPSSKINKSIRSLGPYDSHRNKRGKDFISRIRAEESSTSSDEDTRFRGRQPNSMKGIITFLCFWNL